MGYRQALRWIHDHHNDIGVTPDSILRLHTLCQGGTSGDAGRLKARNNEIIELLPNGERRVRFVPTSAADTPHALEQLCLGYRDVIAQEGIPPLFSIAALVFDFLCVHPFRDGNGRVSRLLTLLVLRREGFHVGAYIGLERLVESSKEGYYDALARSSEGWHQQKHDLHPWLHFFLSTLRAAYGELAERFEKMQIAPDGRSELVRRVIQHQTRSFTLAQLRALCPTVSTQTIKKVLQELRRRGDLKLEGKGRGARWSRALPE
ncbi:MAG: Fic family protein [Deltaproteobacteria bacterium]|nr:Fic family protein [Deltaproteobacteria bacterium]